MQYSRSKHFYWQQVQIATFGIAFLAAAVLSLACAAPAMAATLDRVRQTGKITLGYRADARPFAYRDETGNADGYAAALCKQVAEQLKSDQGLSTLAVEWVPVNVEDQFRAVQENKVDLLCGAVETLASRKDVDFSVPIFLGGIGAALRTDAPIGLREVISGRPPSAPVPEKQVFSVVPGTPGDKWLAAELDKFQLNAKIIPVEGYDAGIRRILNRSSNVFFADRYILLDAAKRIPITSANDLMVLQRQFTHTPFALALEHGDDDFRLVVDRILGQFFGSAKFNELYVRWFGKPDESAITLFRLSTLPE
jgi:putrescine:ornithine antiporter